MIELHRSTPPARPMVYELSGHARLRLGERTSMGEQALLDALSRGKAIPMNLAEGHFEGCVYELFFSQPDSQFFVAVTKPQQERRGGIVVTILMAAQHEADRGPIPPAFLVMAARRALSDEEFAAYGQAVIGQIRDLAESVAAQPSQDAEGTSALPLLGRGTTEAMPIVARATLQRVALLLLPAEAYVELARHMAGQVSTPRPRQVRLLVHYWDSEHNAKCLRLSNPKVPGKHLADHGLAAVHCHPQFPIWLAEKLNATGIDEPIKIERIQAYLTDSHRSCPAVELDLDARLVDNPEPYLVDVSATDLPEPTGGLA